MCSSGWSFIEISALKSFILLKMCKVSIAEKKIFYTTPVKYHSQIRIKYRPALQVWPEAVSELWAEVDRFASETDIVGKPANIWRNLRQHQVLQNTHL